MYDDVVDILCLYENTLEDMFEKAGLIEVSEGTKAAASGVSLPGAASRLDQPGAHRRNYGDNGKRKT